VPGIGKSTALKKIIKFLENRNLIVGGMVSSEIRSAGNRVGFEIVDILTGKKGILAHINQPEGPQIGKYRVNLYDLDEIGAKAIYRAVNEANFIIVDEIGPMELFSQEFRKAVRKAVDGPKPVVGAIHFKAKDPLITEIKTRRDTEIIEITTGNRDLIPKIIIDKIIKK
jgi:nucleoside-triphosphatase